MNMKNWNEICHIQILKYNIVIKIILYQHKNKEEIYDKLNSTPEGRKRLFNELFWDSWVGILGTRNLYCSHLVPFHQTQLSVEYKS